jgi:phage gp36-like protein
MAYCTQDDLAKLIPPLELAQLTAEAGDEPDEAVVAAAIDQAGAEIDSYLAVRYQLPLPETPARLTALAADLAAYRIYSRRSVMSQVRRDNYTSAIAFLKDVAAGKAHLAGLTGIEPPGVAETVTEISSQPRVFDRGSMGDF